MASTYTTNAGIELIGTGEQSGTWGTTTNTNLQIVDRLTNGVGSITLSGTTHTLTTSDGTLSDGQYAVLVFGGSPSGTNTVTISPNTNQHVYVVKNNSGQSVVLTQGSGGNVTVANGKSAIVYADGAGSGAAVVDVTGTFDLGTVTSVGGTGTVNGITLTGTVTSSGNLTLGGTFSATVSEISDLTATASEINILDGVTASTAEINILDGVTASTAEINILDGVTASTAEINLLDGVTATTAELNYVDVTTLGTSEASKAVTTDANGVTTFDGGVVEDDTTITSSTGAATINCRDGNVFSHTLTEDVTYTFSNAPASGRAFGFTLKVVQDSTARTITWPAAVDWPNGSAPDAPASGETDVLVFYTTDGGTTWYGFQAGDAMA